MKSLWQSCDTELMCELYQHLNNDHDELTLTVLLDLAIHLSKMKVEESNAVISFVNMTHLYKRNRTLLRVGNVRPDDSPDKRILYNSFVMKKICQIVQCEESYYNEAVEQCNIILFDSNERNVPLYGFSSSVGVCLNDFLITEESLSNIHEEIKDIYKSTLTSIVTMHEFIHYLQRLHNNDFNFSSPDNGIEESGSLVEIVVLGEEIDLHEAVQKDYITKEWMESFQHALTEDLELPFYSKEALRYCQRRSPGFGFKGFQAEYCK